MDISIITICKNSADYILHTIESVLAQKKINYEYIIVDGKSIDGTVEIINHIKLSNPRMHFISEKDQGISDAMNKGASLAKGKLLFFLHSGDVLCGDDVLHNVYQSYCNFNWEWASGNLMLSRAGRVLHGIKYIPKNIKNIKNKNCIPHQSTFITNILFKKSGGFDISLEQAMDYHLWLRLKYSYNIDNFNLNQDIAIFDVDGESSSIIPLLIGNIGAHIRIRKISNDILLFNTIILITGVIYHWLKYRLKLILIVSIGKY
jgi:glycosyltransferase involved in cell wall biosynthesis